jgi:hypothetical protein
MRSRTCRLIFQHPQSPLCVNKQTNTDLPALTFLKSAPVYFDRHTLSLKNAAISLYTLDGRLRFQVEVSAQHNELFQNEKLNEISLLKVNEQYQLRFWFGPRETEEESGSESHIFPDYVLIYQDDRKIPSNQHIQDHPTQKISDEVPQNHEQGVAA